MCTRRLRDIQVFIGRRFEIACPLKLVGRVGLDAICGKVLVPQGCDGMVCAIDRRASVEGCVILAHDAATFGFDLPVVEQLFFVACERVVSAVIVVRLEDEEGLRARLRDPIKIEVVSETERGVGRKQGSKCKGTVNNLILIGEP